MIIKALFELVFVLLRIVFAPINIPALPGQVQSVIDKLIDIFRGAVGLLSVFVDIDVVKYLIPFVILIVNFDRVYKLVIFILKKIPFLGIK